MCASRALQSTVTWALDHSLKKTPGAAGPHALAAPLSPENWQRARIVSVSDDCTWVFDDQDNGGGSGTFPYRVTGKPGPDGVIPKLGRTIDALPAN